MKNSGGIGVLGVLGIVFIALKLTNIDPVASWSWWWVTLPFWGGFAAGLTLMLVLFLKSFVMHLWEHRG